MKKKDMLYLGFYDETWDYGFTWSFVLRASWRNYPLIRKSIIVSKAIYEGTEIIIKDNGEREEIPKFIRMLNAKETVDLSRKCKKDLKEWYNRFVYDYDDASLYQKKRMDNIPLLPGLEVYARLKKMKVREYDSPYKYHYITRTFILELL
jgi:hypothetical protein